MFKVLKKAEAEAETKFEVLSHSSKGIRRENEDSLLAMNELYVYAVADGMGGHQGGKECSNFAIEMLEDDLNTLEQIGKERVFNASFESRLLVETVKRLNGMLIKKCKAKKELQDAGSTLTVARFFPREKHVVVVHVGDTRVVRYRKSTRTQELVSVLPMTKDHGYRNLLTNCMGPAQGQSKFFVDAKDTDYKSGDLFLISSDGVHDYADVTPLVRAYLHTEQSLEKLRDELAKECERVSEDNYSFILIQV